MQDVQEQYEQLLQVGARRLKGHERRLFQAEVCLRLCEGNPRRVERRFGWGRENVRLGLREYQTGIRCVENFAAKGRRGAEERNPKLAEDIRAIVQPHSYVDPELKSSRRYSNLSAGEVREALQAKGWCDGDLPSERSMRDILNRMNFRLKRIQKGKPLKKTPQTDAIFANVKAAHEEARSDPQTLEISMDTKAKVKMGDYVQGGKMQDG